MREYLSHCYASFLTLRAALQQAGNSLEIMEDWLLLNIQMETFLRAQAELNKTFLTIKCFLLWTHIILITSVISVTDVLPGTGRI